ncbi:MAG TPA: hypothetical protein VLJ11_10625, partial [Bryobacteraceae bacterium]|nr:hypothetical protein [Bryobacteraceae bacterium]
ERGDARIHSRRTVVLGVGQFSQRIHVPAHFGDNARSRQSRVESSPKSGKLRPSISPKICSDQRNITLKLSV